MGACRLGPRAFWEKISLPAGAKQGPPPRQSNEVRRWLALQTTPRDAREAGLLPSARNTGSSELLEAHQQIQCKLKWDKSPVA
ncbi:hypothetical protein NDU88_003123 [Pleurodeles waltl]|uniref:Uncharacterized protein n=1 Tax=Pleurodeles waltl TaxID=8319 RepID=A0AAV7UZ63_PLEWA|nr:hypothetical protein NDU88_003123 [Pleurodeles waltl]